MRREFPRLAIASFAFVVTHAALAADLLLKAPAVEGPTPLPGWGGFYIGGNIGYSRAKDDLTAADFTVYGVSIPGAPFAGLKPSGAIAGAQAGYNWQSSYWVYGFETDFQWSGEGDSISSSGPATFTPGTGAATCFGEDVTSCTLTDATGAAGPPGAATLAAKIDWFGTFRGRIGIASDRYYWYATGGLAYGRVRFSGAASFTEGTFKDSGTHAHCTTGCPASGSAAFADSPMGLGWTLGTGVEGAIPFGRNWTWRAEYLFVDLDRIGATTTNRSSVSITGLTVQPVNAPLSHSAVVMDHVLRFGINYRFGGDPVVTAY
jgi:outer membrane immunogenic protein